jgi:hypothetical protein
LLLSAGSAFSHLDAPRVSLSQLFLSADVVTIARIEEVADRRFLLDEKPTLQEVISARVYKQYKGSALESVDFFQDAHGHAHYVSGDLALLFLETLGSSERLTRVGSAAGVYFVSKQVRNTEHVIQPSELSEYEWVLSAYAQLGSAEIFSPERRNQQLKTILMRMLVSNSPDIVESGLLDWEHAGSGIQLAESDVAELLVSTREQARPINLRLATLRAMQRKQLVDGSAWIYLFQNETDENLLSVIKSTRGYETALFLPYLVRQLDSPSETLVEAAARALGHPAYGGAEAALEPLLDRPNQRLNYAAVYALLGLENDKARSILLEAEASHPDPKVRRMISARLGPLSLLPDWVPRIFG